LGVENTGFFYLFYQGLVFLLVLGGLFGVLLANAPVKKAVAFLSFQAGILLFFLSLVSKETTGTLHPAGAASPLSNSTTNPLPLAMAIVLLAVSLIVFTVLLALAPRPARRSAPPGDGEEAEGFPA
jgi:multisubunit Na+/H+ antiporter MnhC subunit